MRYWLFFPVLIWGHVINVFTGYYYDNYNFLDINDSFYDKLAPRSMPGGRVWARPA